MQTYLLIEWGEHDVTPSLIIGDDPSRLNQETARQVIAYAAQQPPSLNQWPPAPDLTDPHAVQAYLEDVGDAGLVTITTLDPRNDITRL